MRKNKKLLLGGLSVLTLVAAGSGAVSTFAWYSVTAHATPAYTAFDDATVNTATTSFTLGTVTFTPHFRAAAADIKSTSDVTAVPTAIELSSKSDSAPKKGAIVAGSPSLVAVTAECYQIIGVCVEATLSGESAGVTLQQALKELYDNDHEYIDVSITPEGNTVVKAATAYNDNLATVTTSGLFDQAILTADSSWRITLENDGSVAKWQKFYAVAVRPNNAEGKEYVKSGDAKVDYSTVIKATDADGATTDAIGYDKDTYEIETYANSTWSGSNPKTFLHDANNLHATVAEYVD